MSEIIFKIPKLEELGYRKKILADKDTMEYNKKWGWTIDFDESKWDSWYQKWIGNTDKNYFYAYIETVDTKELVGEVAYHYDYETDTVMLNIIIEGSKRGFGYGKKALYKLVDNAFKSGFNEVRDTIACDNIGAQKMFDKFGFLCVDKNDDYYDYRLKKEDFK